MNGILEGPDVDIYALRCEIEREFELESDRMLSLFQGLCSELLGKASKEIEKIENEESGDECPKLLPYTPRVLRSRKVARSPRRTEKVKRSTRLRKDSVPCKKTTCEEKKQRFLAEEEEDKTTQAAVKEIESSLCLPDKGVQPPPIATESQDMDSALSIKSKARPEQEVVNYKLDESSFTNVDDVSSIKEDDAKKKVPYRLCQAVDSDDDFEPVRMTRSMAKNKITKETTSKLDETDADTSLTKSTRSRAPTENKQLESQDSNGVDFETMRVTRSKAKDKERTEKKKKGKSSRKKRGKTAAHRDSTLSLASTVDSSVIDLDVTEDHPIEPITQKDSIDLKDVTADVAVQQDEYKPLEVDLPDKCDLVVDEEDRGKEEDSMSMIVSSSIPPPVDIIPSYQKNSPHRTRSSTRTLTSKHVRSGTYTTDRTVTAELPSIMDTCSSEDPTSTRQSVEEELLPQPMDTQTVEQQPGSTTDAEQTKDQNQVDGTGSSLVTNDPSKQQESPLEQYIKELDAEKKKRNSKGIPSTQSKKDVVIITPKLNISSEKEIKSKKEILDEFFKDLLKPKQPFKKLKNEANGSTDGSEIVDKESVPSEVEMNSKQTRKRSSVYRTPHEDDYHTADDSVHSLYTTPVDSTEAQEHPPVSDSSLEEDVSSSPTLYTESKSNTTEMENKALWSSWWAGRTGNKGGGQVKTNLTTVATAQQNKPVVKSFLTSSSPETVSQEKKKKKDLLEKMAEKNKRLKELELKRQKEQEERIKKHEQKAKEVLDRRARMMEEQSRKLNQLVNKEEKRGQLLEILQKKRLEDAAKRKKEYEEKSTAVIKRKKQQEVEFQKKLAAQLEEERKLAEENERRRLEYEEKQRKKEEEKKCFPLMSSPQFIKPTTTVAQHLKSVPETSYPMTPDVLNENYNIDDLNSSADTDDEEQPSKPVPLWAQSHNVTKSFRQQDKIDLTGGIIDQVFPAKELMKDLDLVAIFGRKRSRYHKRTSSACWDTPPRKKYFLV